MILDTMANMFEAQNRSQPKLVYAHASTSDTNRESEADMSSYVRNLVARIASEDVSIREPIQKEPQSKETGKQVNSSQSVGQENTQGLNKQTVGYEGQGSQPKQTDLDYAVSKNTKSDISRLVKSGNEHLPLSQRVTYVVQGSNRSYTQPNSVLHDKMVEPETNLRQTQSRVSSTTSVVDTSAVNKKLTPVSSLSPAATVDKLCMEVQSVTRASDKAEPKSASSNTRGKENSIVLPATPGIMDRSPLVKPLSSVVPAERLSSSLSSSTKNAERVVTLLSRSQNSDNSRPASAHSALESEVKIGSLSPTAGQEKLQRVSSVFNDAAESKPPTIPSIVKDRLDAAESLSDIASVENVAKLSPVLPASEYHVSTVSIDPVGLKYSGSIRHSNTNPKQIYSSSTASSHGDNVKQQNASQQQLQSQQVNQSHTQRQDTKLHTTTINIHSLPQNRQQSSLSINQSTNSKPMLHSPSAATAVSNKLQPVAIPSSKQSLDTSSDTKLHEKSELPTSLPLSSSENSSCSVPKSILKHTTSFDKIENILIPGDHKDMSADHVDFSSQMTTKDDSLIRRKQVQSFFKTNMHSPPPQLKRHVTGDISAGVSEPSTDGKMLKKSVTFNSEVRLHLDNDESTTEPLPVEM